MVEASSLVGAVRLLSGERLDGLRYLVGIAVVVKRAMQGTNTLLPAVVHVKEEKEKKDYGG